MENLNCQTQNVTADEIRKELRTLASIDVGLLGSYARRAMHDRMQLLAFKLQEATA